MTPSFPSQPAGAHGFGVLLVDDDHHHRTPLLRALREHGHRVLHAADGVAGESLCREAPREIDALVTCVDMKRMGGLELARRVDRMNPGVLVLLMSRGGAEPAESESLHERAHERGYEVIDEPYTPDDLCRTLSDLLDAGTPLDREHEE